MDPLSATASIIAVLQLTGRVLTYLHDVKDAPKECKECMIDISNSNTLLLRLNLRLSEATSSEPWYREVETLAAKDGLLDQYRLALQRLQDKVNPTKAAKRLSTKLLWTSVKNDVAAVQGRLQRLTSLVSIALEMDHL